MSNETPAPSSLHPEHSEIPSDLSDSELYAPAYPLPPPRGKFKDRVWRHVLLFAVTILTTTVVGAEHYANFLSEFGRVDINFE